MIDTDAVAQRRPPPSPAVTCASGNERGWMDDALFEHAIAKLREARLNPAASCKLCGADSPLFDVIDFSKSCEGFSPSGASGIPVVYRRCRECQFIFTNFFDEFTSDMWRKHVYNSEYASVDPEYRTVRPQVNAHLLRTFLKGRKSSTIGLDYGGGNGKTAALMVEQGWSFDSYDPYDQTIMDAHRIGKYNFCSAIEVFEHAPDPIGSIRDILSLMSQDRLIIMIGTSLSDGVVSDQSRLSWWYAAPRNGHVSLYSRKSFSALASRFELQCLLLGRWPIFMFRGHTATEIRNLVIRGKLLRKLHFANPVFSRPRRQPVSNES
jgi:hypothetical protein